MALAVKSPPCCCSSLRSSSLTLLYFNLVLNAYALFSPLWMPMYIQTITMGMGFLLYINIFIVVSACLIFLATLITIYKNSPSPFFLTASVCFLLLNVVHSLCVVIVLTVTGDIGNVYGLEPPKKKDNNSLSVWFNNEEELETLSTIFMSFMLAIGFACVVFQLYSALILHSYKEDMKQRTSYGMPPAQNDSAPYPPNAQFVNTQYPVQPSQYPTQSALSTKNYP